MKKETLNIILSIGAVVLVAVLGSVFVNLGMDWFDSLRKPTEWIPNIVIPIVWTVIYSVFAIYLFFTIKKEKELDMELMWLLIINGVLNVLWCLVFFTLNSLLWGLIAIILNLIAATILLRKMRERDGILSYILTIYPIWLSVATCLNLACWILN